MAVMKPSGLRPDPVFVHGRREALWILALWTASLLWTIPVCYALGDWAAPAAGDAEASLRVFGLPAWVWWGVALPWVVCGVLSILLSLFGIADDPLDDSELVS